MVDEPAAWHKIVFGDLMIAEAKDMWTVGSGETKKWVVKIRPSEPLLKAYKIDQRMLNVDDNTIEKEYNYDTCFFVNKRPGQLRWLFLQRYDGVMGDVKEVVDHELLIQRDSLQKELAVVKINLYRVNSLLKLAAKNPAYYREELLRELERSKEILGEVSTQPLGDKQEYALDSGGGP